MKYILYSHDGSENHGCEALVRSTISALNESGNEKFVLVSTRPEEDEKYGLGKYCRIVRKNSNKIVKKTKLQFWKAYYQLKVKKDYMAIDDLYENAVIDAKKGDIALSIGGDVYCYGGTKELARKNNLFRRCGAKTVYWGCSIEPELLNVKEIADDIAKFDLITARESISYEALKKVNPNTILVSDSAFLLEKEEVVLPKEFENSDLVGINLSPLVEEVGKNENIVRENYVNLMRYILDNTEMKILLIPHVMWESVSDKPLLEELYHRFKESGRVLLVENNNCMKLKGYISKCRFFVGARTHATIAAYSTYVPTIVVGYSVKAKGIAKDLFGTYENYVISAQDFDEKNDLAKDFAWMMQNEKEIKVHLEQIIPEYKKKVYLAIDTLKRL